MRVVIEVALLLSLLLAGCARSAGGNDVETVILVTVSSITSDLRILRANATLNGSAAQKIEDFVANPPAQQFGLSLPAGVSGAYSLVVAGVSATGCVVSRGQASADISGQARVDLNVVLGALVTPDCSAVPVACSDEAQNGTETDVDCGGTICQKCEVGQTCDSGSDCLTNSCAMGLCAPASSCKDGAKGGSETDVDCGGPTCAKCGDGKSCLAPSDCENGSCVSGKCGLAPFTVTKIEPAEGPINMTVPITLTGTGFSGTMSVSIGATAATGLMIVSPTQLKAVAPLRMSSAVVDVVVQQSGAGSVTLPKAFRYFGGPVGLGAPAVISTPGFTEGVSVADLNADGKADVMATSPSTDQILVFLGKGDGTFQAGVPYVTGDGPSRIAAADLNMDNKLDLVVSTQGAGALNVFLGRGDGTFQAKADYAAATGCVGVSVGDVSGDGKPDVVVAHRGAENNISLFLGKGDGTLQARIVLAAGSSPHELALADLNGDGKLDILNSNITNSYLAVLISQGAGAFASRALYTTPFFSFGVVTSDFNGDGKPDAAVTSSGGTDMAVLPGKGDGSLLVPVATTVGSGIRALAAADLDKDGRLDAVAITSGGANILLGKGDGSFQAPVTTSGIRTGSPTGAGYTMALGDLNGDGKLDVVSANGTSFAVLLGTAN